MKSPQFSTLRQQIYEYFKGKRKEFTIPLVLIGIEFQKQAWKVYGNTVWKHIPLCKTAELIGSTSAVKAVENANGKNKISIILPCHMIIGTYGKLTGYCGGIGRKDIAGFGKK